ncbi:capsular polysaccharide synthesis protein [Parabacteroides sp. PF5-9]|uniref:capsular polysaccharide synthesis protein n=1 Tax=Parabacteroides sp. PF5-9 TaxID=1742404 RepID=UPI002475AC86|nr:capsular polysaccharide synthesis protein [Parabacteroides sp. PF5-9]MDH6356776.1 hypothetical protein [Parabacteroides sp. PF5-9]
MTNLTYAFNLPVQFKRYKQKRIKRQLLKKYSYLLQDSKLQEEQKKADTRFLYPIWVCWWQGEEKMPELVKACYQSLLQGANGHPVHLITKENYTDYITLPSYIMEKVESGMITLTHLSDIIRVCLIYTHGGLWIDSTILVTQSLPEFDSCFFSIKHKKKGVHVSDYRWTSFLLYGEKENLLCYFLRLFFFTYWERECKLITYLMIDYVISIAYDAIPAITKMIDDVPFNNLHHNDLRYLLKTNEAYNTLLFQELCSETYLHKLTWKRAFEKYTKKNEWTFYEYLIVHYLHEDAEV